MSRISMALAAAIGLTLLTLLALACDGDGAGDGGDSGDLATPTVVLPTVPSSPTPELSGGEVGLRFYGHAMFQLFSPEGTTILIDPHIGLGYREERLFLQTNATIVTHNHFDHDKVVEGGANSEIIRGVALEDGDWTSVDETVGDVAIRNIRTFHDESEGEDRGKNSMFLFEVAGLRILHAGDLGHVLTDEQVQDVGPIDVLMIPTGGATTLSLSQVDEVIEELKPKLVFPMHYRTEVLKNISGKEDLATLEDFLAGKTNVEEAEGNTYSIEASRLPEATTIVVLDYK